MAGETSFLSNDYIQAASAFGSNLGSTVLSSLHNVGGNVSNAATGAANQTGEYLSSLTNNQQSDQQNNSNKKETVNNSNAISPASFVSMFGNGINLDKLSNGMSALSVPNILSTAGNVGNTLASNLTFGASTALTKAVTENTINPTISNTPKSNTVDNSNTLNQMLNPALPTITDPSRIMTPLSQDAMSMLKTVSTPAMQVNSMVFDASGNLVKYTGSGAQQLVTDMSKISSDVTKTATEAADVTMETLTDTGSKAGDMTKQLVWDTPYMMGGYTGELIGKTGDISKSQLDNILNKAPDITIGKKVNSDGTTEVIWKSQEKPQQSKSYPKEKESVLFNKGDKYITEGIADNLKQKTFTKTHADGSVTTTTHIPGQSQMLIKGLVLDVDSNESNVSGDVTNGKFDPVAKLNKMIREDGNKYYYSEQIEDKDKEEKEKKKNKDKVTYRKRQNRFIPKVMIIKPQPKKLPVIKPISKKKSVTIHTMINDHPRLLTNANFGKVMNKITGSVNTIDSVITLGSSNKTSIIKGTPQQTVKFDNIINTNKQILSESNFDFNMKNLSVNIPDVTIGIKKKKSKK